MYPVLVNRLLLSLPLIVACSDYQVIGKTFAESFYQAGRESGVDILWVVDDSATMYEEHDLLMESADSFIAFVANSAVDFHLGVVSTDMDVDPGMLRGPVLNVDSTEMVDRFVDQIGSALAGSRDERGFDAALMGADPALNPDFSRAKADLEVVIFSDEDDHSAGDTDAFLSALSDLRPGAQIKVHAVVGDPPAGCVSALAAADVGERYLEVQAATEGRRESICTLDYGAMLARVALDVIGLDTTFALSKIPGPESIALLVDSVAVARREHDGWRYNPGDNTIIFDGFAVPKAGAVIEVRYSEWNGPLEDLTNAED